ncbi:MAG: sialidase family protein [Pseudomonadota bacterium]
MTYKPTPFTRDSRRRLPGLALRWLLTTMLSLAGLAHAAESEHAHGDSRAPSASAPAGARMPMSPFTCIGTSLACATAASPAWAKDGALWLTWVANGVVSVARSTDRGLHFSPATVIGRHEGVADVGADARPQIAIDAADRITVLYDVFKDSHWNAEILVSRSTDGGQHFSAPRLLMAQTAGQRFPTVALDTTGGLFVAWIDRRLAMEAADKGIKRQGAAVAYAWSDDAGAHFTPARIAYTDSCECCRMGVAMRAPGRPVIVLRGVLDQRVRDHVVITFKGRHEPGTAQRVSDDNWVTNACPHHGPAITVGAEGTYHVAWYTQSPTRSGLFYARSTDEGKTFSAPMRIGQAQQPSSRPNLLAQGARVWMAWKTFDGQATSLYVQTSRDAGEHWSAPKVLAQSKGYSDHPLLTTQGNKVYLSWLAHDEGYQLIELAAP